MANREWKWELKYLEWTSRATIQHNRGTPGYKDGLSYGYLNSRIYSSDTGISYWCNASSTYLGPINLPKYTQETWIDCKTGDTFQPTGTTSTRLLFNYNTFEFKISQDGQCATTKAEV